MIFHLSHIDLDGYGCQFITKNVFHQNIKFFNSNYGKEIDFKLNKIFEEIGEYNPFDKHTIIITDLNLTDEQSAILDSRVKNQNNINLILIDHHGTGSSSAEKYEWYHLDISKCATMLTFEYFENALFNNEKYPLIKRIAEYVNVTDMWIAEHKDFKKASFLSDIVFNAFKFPKMMEEQNVFMRLSFIEAVVHKLESGASIRDIESSLVEVKESFLKDKLQADVFDCKDTQIDHKYFRYIFDLLKDKEIPVFKVEHATFKIFFELGASTFQYVSYMYNSEIGDVDFLVHVNDRGSMSFRSIGDEENKRVDKIAKKYFNGGGHRNAAGGNLGENIYGLNELKAIELITNIIKEKNNGNNI